MDSKIPDAIDWATVTPRRRSSVAGHDLSGEMVLYDERLQSAVALNESAASIWALCDGNRTSREIADGLAANLGIAETTLLLADVEKALDELFKLNLLDVDSA